MTFPELSTTLNVLTEPTNWEEEMYTSRARVSVPTTLARYLAVNVPNLVRRLGIRLEDQLETDLPALQMEWQEELQSQAARK